MSKLSRREFVYMMAVLGAAPVFANSHTRMVETTKKLEDYYKLKPFGNARLLHMTDSHAQLLPVYFREPSVNLGFFSNFGKPPHIVGEKLLDYYGIKGNKRLEYAYSCVNFEEHAKVMGRTGGFSQIKTVVDFLRDSFGKEKTLLLDGGDTWQGTATALWTRGKDMVGAMNLLGVDVAVGHWEFTYKAEEVLENVKALNAEFLAQNIFVKEDSLMNGVEAYDEDSGLAFKPYTIKQLGKARVAIIGQAFPYTTIANPQRFIPDWTFGIKDDNMQEIVNKIKEEEKPDAIIVLSHNGFDTDKKMAEVVSGIDFIMGGHTHDGVPEAVPVKNATGTTYVCNAGSNGKFLNVLDLDIQNGKIKDFKFTLLPIFSDLITEDKDMKKYIEDVRLPYLKELTREIATTEQTLFRRGNFNGSWDQIICDALLEVKEAQISLSPGFRWGTSVMPGQAITFDDLMTQTAMTYPETYARDIKGTDIKAILEDVADNLFNEDPFYQQGGDMVRTGGISYKINPKAKMGERISDIVLTKTGEKLDASKAYKVAGWSTVGAQSEGEPVWETVETYLKNVKHISNIKVDTPDIIGVKGNPGII
ncbi:MAG: thiosulfohydrolase SoxB [Arcobacter sp.]|jgi:sulfur-oxidizing protein SoxB|uniref:Sulfur oxidation protein, thiosulfate hydrolase n=1 Tax=Arcobacter defluvii TaxID=873191 RepID=A0AAE7BF59_9BACT|nr:MULTISPECIES: thiosulfohydrolase SoxB [Arcobacter]MDY3200953.1 thiosulfohydrolase SoxB [Arcobacter sp.]QKF76756.1 sulfur oxidation protein, thiosulfate hydrolase [Arcobacter defluvii]RXI34897.1 thiosulfohydrolase SoxB [Arcobacter defluvii]BAK72568.1 sulfur oxidation protein SoxB [Arcobacter sp. L]